MLRPKTRHAAPRLPPPHGGLTADELFTLFFGAFPLGHIDRGKNDVIGRAGHKRSGRPGNKAVRSIFRCPIILGVRHVGPWTRGKEERRECPVPYLVQRIAQNPLEGAARTNDLLLGIEDDNNAVGRVENRRNEVALGLKLNVQFPNLIVVVGQFSDHLLKKFGLPFYLFRFLMQLNECDDLRSQNFGNKWFGQVIDRAKREAPHNVLFGLVDGRQKNDGRVPGALPLPDESSRLEAIEDRHVHIEKNDRELLIEQETQRLESGVCPDKILPQITQQGFEREKIFGVIVDQKNIDLVIRHAAPLWPAHSSKINGPISSMGRILSTAIDEIADCGIVRPSAVEGS